MRVLWQIHSWIECLLLEENYKKWTKVNINVHKNVFVKTYWDSSEKSKYFLKRVKKSTNSRNLQFFSLVIPFSIILFITIKFNNLKNYFSKKFFFIINLFNRLKLQFGIMSTSINIHTTFLQFLCTLNTLDSHFFKDPHIKPLICKHVR